MYYSREKEDVSQWFGAVVPLDLKGNHALDIAGKDGGCVKVTMGYLGDFNQWQVRVYWADGCWCRSLELVSLMVDTINLKRIYTKKLIFN